MPPQPPRRDQENPFGDFMSAFNPNRAPGRGIDHQPSDPFFPDGFPFVGSWGAPHPPGPPGPPHPPGAAHSHVPHPRPPPGGWQGFSWWTGDDDDDDGDDAEFHHDHHNHHHHHGRHSRRGGRHGRRGRHPDDDNDGGTRDHPMTVGSDNEATNTDREKQPENEKADSPNTMKDDVPDPDEVLPDDDSQLPPPPYGRGHCGRGGRGGCRRGGRGRGRNSNSNSNDMPFNFPGLMRGVASHPFFQHMSNAAYQYRNGMHPTAAAATAAAGAPSSSSDSDSFAPPVDTFNTEAAYILHVALPGAKKDDIGVNWNPDVGELTISGVVHRPGDEEFLKTMHAAERRVGMFERKVTLPPVGLAEQRRDDVVDGMGITAKLEDGLLVVVVPKVEKGWTEIRKVDIE